MATELGPDTERSFCGNCGTAIEPGVRVCSACGEPVAEPPPRGEPAPRDYIPYCRNCGVGVPWGRGHTCQRCGVSPLCDLHIHPATGRCFDCADAPSYSGGAAVAGAQRCGACGMLVAPFSDFCPNCGRGLAAQFQGMEYMGFWIRLAAFVADWIFAYLVAALIAAIIGISLTSGEVDPQAMEDLTIAIENFNYSFLILFGGISVVHGAVMTAFRGQTLGKMLLRIQVVDAEGNVPSWQKAILRELLRGVILMALFPLGLLYVWVSLDSRKRGPHDYLSGSYVVRKQRSPTRRERGF